MKLAISATPARANFAPILLQGNINEAFVKAAEYGYDGIELHLRDPHEIDWDQTLELTKKYLLPVTALGTGAGARVDGLTFTNPDTQIRQEALKRIEEHLKLAKLLDCAIILGSMNGNIQGDEKRKEYHNDCIKKCCDLATKDEISLLIEPLNRYESDWLNTANDTLGVIKQVGYPNLKYLADTFHMNIEEVDICQSLRSTGEHLGYLHLVDNNRQVPGHGHISFSEIIKTLKDISYDGILTFECLAVPDTKTASIDALSLCKKLIADYF